MTYAVLPLDMTSVAHRFTDACFNLRHRPEPMAIPTLQEACTYRREVEGVPNWSLGGPDSAEGGQEGAAIRRGRPSSGRPASRGTWPLSLAVGAGAGAGAGGRRLPMRRSTQSRCELV